MKRVDLGWNKLEDDMTALLSTCLHNIEELFVSCCQLTARGIENISVAISKRTVPVNPTSMI